VDAGLVLEQFKKAATDRRAPAKPAAKEPAAVPAVERILLNAVIASAEVRNEILPMLTPDLIAEFQTREILETLRHMMDSGAGVTFSGLDARLTPELQSLLHEVVAADDISDETLSLELARACLRSLEGSAAKRRIDELRARVKSAEREGQVEDALAWMVELGRLEKEASSARSKSGGESGAAGVVH
jgi:hypothetical protein